MKIVPVLAIAGMMLAGTAFAAAGTTSPATGASPSTPSATHQASAKNNCRAEARAKKLTGAERAKFVKECTSTKT
jgi:hypothetical protein